MMKIRDLVFVGMFAALAASSYAAPQLIGTVTLDCTGSADDDGPFQWVVAGHSGTGSLFYDGQTVVTYCFSTNNFFSGSGDWNFNVYTLSGATLTNVGPLVSSNNDVGLTATSFLAAAAEAEADGAPVYHTTPSVADNNAIHATEADGDSAPYSPSATYDDIIYLQQAGVPGNPSAGGQPQAYIPVPEPFTMTLAAGALGLAARRRFSSKPV